MARVTNRDEKGEGCARPPESTVRGPHRLRELERDDGRRPFAGRGRARPAGVQCAGIESPRAHLVRGVGCGGWDVPCLRATRTARHARRQRAGCRSLSRRVRSDGRIELAGADDRGDDVLRQGARGPTWWLLRHCGDQRHGLPRHPRYAGPGRTDSFSQRRRRAGLRRAQLLAARPPPGTARGAAGGVNRRTLGRTGLSVSEIGFGAWAIGGNAFGNSYGPTDDAESTRAIRRAFELGCNFFDTADVYGHGHSESLLGPALHDVRDQVFIATKVGGNFYDGDVHMDFTPAYLRFAVERSLERLRSDHIDLLQLHNPPLNLIAAMATYEPLEEMKGEGLIRFYGVSVHPPEEGVAAVQATMPDTVQIVYNLARREAEDTFLLTAHAANAAGAQVRARSPGDRVRDRGHEDGAAGRGEPQLRGVDAEQKSGGRDQEGHDRAGVVRGRSARHGREFREAGECKVLRRDQIPSRNSEFHGPGWGPVLQDRQGTGRHGRSGIHDQVRNAEEHTQARRRHALHGACRQGHRREPILHLSLAAAASRRRAYRVRAGHQGNGRRQFD